MEPLNCTQSWQDYDISLHDFLANCRNKIYRSPIRDWGSGREGHTLSHLGEFGLI